MQPIPQRGEFIKEGETLVFTGKFSGGAVERFNAFVDKQSFSSFSLRGSEMYYSYDYLKVGSRLKGFKLKLSVDGLCIDGCASYLFLAGTTKERQIGGVVGFKGDEPDFNEAGLLRSFDRFRLSDAAKTDGLDNYRSHKSRELEFLVDIGIKRDLFDDAQKMVLAYTAQIDPLGSAKIFRVFWVPSNSELSCYGVTGLKDDFSLTEEDKAKLKNSFTQVFSSSDLKTKPRNITKCVK